ncbi:putative vegetative incompatibility protein HET-E-1 [Rhizoctonia solani 123E]|uniref:Putative vegetative incompatibility protein HET-E-1 n=1 Tax=Rhizoctonia solani 123E TaxID=1423351 RepID=A0A074S1T0_9AGAM|nr:putative vegetative incompatibility protein HET-E-1 [Rhizoctonia solani 123E]
MRNHQSPRQTKEMVVHMLSQANPLQQLGRLLHIVGPTSGPLLKLWNKLQDHFPPLKLPYLNSREVLVPTMSIQDEIAYIRNRKGKRKLRDYLEMEQGIDAIPACYRRIQGYLQRVSLNLDLSVWRIVDEATKDNRLNSLAPSLSACYNSAQANELKRGPCTEGTRVDLLGQMLCWTKSSIPGSVYWMSGMAGTGKTTIAYSLCEELNTNRQLGASFFCSRLLPECRDVNLIIPSIAYQLARSSYPFRFVLASVLEKDPDVHTRLPHLQFDTLLAQPLFEVKDTLADNLVVVIDALDECDNKESTSQILDILLIKALDLPIKFVVSSRPEPEIRDEMSKQRNQADSRVVLHELDRDAVQADIKSYLCASLARIQPTEDQIAIMVQRAGILFIYAATVVRYISHDGFRRNPHSRLANVLESSSASENKHKEIDELYTTILQAALDNQYLDSHETEDIRQVLYLVICAQEPLSVNALSKLLRMNNTVRVHAALSPLWSVLHISGTSELVTTLHASFVDYMFSSSRSKGYYCNPQIHNHTIARLCFDHFKNIRSQFNICGLESSYVLDDEVEGLGERVKEVIPMEHSYASRYWGAHLRSANRSSELMDELNEFLSVRLLLWMEVMSLIKCTGEMPQVLRLVEIWKGVSLNTLIHDAWKFTSIFALGEISNSTPHIYTSMLPFWPESSPVSHCYKAHMQGMIQAEGTAIDQQQHALLATWSFSHGILSSEFSPDSTRIALGSGKLVLLLSASTGRSILPSFKGHSQFVNSVQFSPDGTRIISGSDDKTIRVWSTQSGATILGPLEGHTGGVWSVAFSPDGARIISGSRDGDIYVWDARSGDRVLELLTGHDEWIRKVKYSPDGNYIISCAYGSKSIVSWDARNGQVLKTLGQQDNHRISSADLSPNGTCVAFSSNSGFYTWNMEEHSTPSRLSFPSNSTPDAITFSPDGLYIIGTRDSKIFVCTANGDIKLGSLDGHTISPSIASSPDGAFIISASQDQTLRLWDTRSVRATPRPLQGHTELVSSVHFSPDGARIASSSLDGTVYVWDAKNGEVVLGPLETENYKLSVAFSPDGTCLISDTKDGLALLDAKSGDIVVGPFQCLKSVWSAGFSPDGTRIISISQENDIWTLDANTGETLTKVSLPPITDPENYYVSTVISPDGSRIAVASNEIGLRMYDAHSSQLIYKQSGNFGSVCSFSPDGTRIGGIRKSASGFCDLICNYKVYFMRIRSMTCATWCNQIYLIVLIAMRSVHFIPCEGVQYCGEISNVPM